MDMTANKNVGANSTIVMEQVNRNDSQQQLTDSNGVVSFDIDQTDYILRSYCASCHTDFAFFSGVQYLISPQSDGTIKMLSAADKKVAKDKDGNFIIETNFKRTVSKVDPWTLLKNRPEFHRDSPEHMYLMTDGKVLMQSRGGRGIDNWWLLAPDNSGSYVNGTWTQIPSPSPNYNPQNMNGAVLHSGKFMIVGGEQNTNSDGVMEENTNQSYIYDEIKNTWTSVQPPTSDTVDWSKIGAAPFIELADGRVMVGHNGLTSNSPGIPAVLFDETKSTWTLTGTNKNTSNNEEGYTLMANDKVFNVWNGDDNPDLLKTAETFDPTTGSWTQTSKAPAITGHAEIGPAISLPNGKVLQMGATGHNELYDPMTNSWSTVPDFPKLNNGLQLSASDNESVVLPSGNVLVITSVFTCSTQNCNFMGPARWFEYDVSTNTWLPVDDDPIVDSKGNVTNGTQVLPLPNGQIMVSEAGNIAFYNSEKSQNIYAPTISNLSASELSPNKNYTLSGLQLAGLTQGTSWGDEQQNQTNYGIVQIKNNLTGHIFYGRSSNFSSTSITPKAPSTFDFTIPSNIENGRSTLQVIASGFASKPVNVLISGGSMVTSNVATKVLTCVKGKIAKKSKGTLPGCKTR